MHITIRFKGSNVRLPVLKYRVEGNVWDEPHQKLIFKAIKHVYDPSYYLFRIGFEALGPILKLEIQNHKSIYQTQNMETLCDWFQNMDVKAYCAKTVQDVEDLFELKKSHYETECYHIAVSYSNHI